MVLDLLANGLLGGSFDESISSRLGRMGREGSVIAGALCAALALVDSDHCRKADADEGG